VNFRSAVIVVAALAAASCTRSAPSLAGDWDASIVSLANVEVPFRFVIAGTPDRLTGTFVNGDERMASTGGSFKDGQLVINFDQYGSKLIARLNGDVLEGEYNRTTRGAPYPFKASRHVPRATDPNPPSIAGEWKIPTPDDRHESAWRFIVRQNGAEVSAAIQRLDGDTGTLTGSFLAPSRAEGLARSAVEGQDGQLVLSHFSGARPMRLEVSVQPDGSLDLLEDGQTHHTAFRMNDPRAAGAGDAGDPTQVTRVKDPDAPLVLQFPDLNGTPVSLSDARFRGKVVILSITGSWCPNCHDEAPFYVDLYKKYRDQGFEIVLLAFEETAQLANPVRLEAFVKQYGITYPVLLAGDPTELTAKLPQFDNLYAFPTSIYIGRDGRVRGTHAGFSGKATGALYTETTEEITRTVEQLLAEKAPESLETDVELTIPALRSGLRPRTPPPRVSVLTSATRRSSTSYDLVLSVQPHAGMHVYAPGATGYNVVLLTFSTAPGVSITPPKYPRAEDYYFAPTKEHLPVYQQTFEVTASARVPPNTKTLDGTLSYQACDDRLCYAPQTVPVSFTLTSGAR
jgi:thiol-disulfide isomerase/thioredoxin